MLNVICVPLGDGVAPDGPTPPAPTQPLSMAATTTTNHNRLGTQFIVSPPPLLTPKWCDGFLSGIKRHRSRSGLAPVAVAIGGNVVPARRGAAAIVAGNIHDQAMGLGVSAGLSPGQQDPLRYGFRRGSPPPVTPRCL